MGLSWSQMLRAKVKRSLLQWSWETYDQGYMFPRNSYCSKILFLVPYLETSLESLTRSGWSPGVKPAADRKGGMREDWADVSFFCSHSDCEKGSQANMQY